MPVKAHAAVFPLISLLLAAGSGDADARQEMPPLECVDENGRTVVATSEIRRVGGSVTKPEVVKRVSPDYSQLARTAVRVQGVIIIETVIHRDGSVCAARLLKGESNPFSAEALAAVRQWRFKPATLRGKPVPVHFVLTVNICPL